MSEDENIPGSRKMYVAPEDVQQMIEDDLKAHGESKLQRFNDNKVNMKVLPLFKDAHE